ncbi:MAG: hypothetical protein KTR35_13240 [Gammaproteobacteria bacterium]|nr:hypothetical protein [Gammaproteobacteria bacterium]
MLALVACVSDSDNSPMPANDTVDALTCTGNRIWDFGASNVVADAFSYISETDGDTFTSSKFPCAVFWEYSPTIGCSLAFTYERWLAEFNVADQLQSLEISGANLITVATDGSRVTGVPAGISVTDLNAFPDCEFR